MDAELIYVQNTMLVKVTGVKDVVNDTLADNSWSLEATLKEGPDSGAAEVGGQTWPHSLSYVTDGEFHGTLESDIDVSEGDEPYLWLDVEGSGLKAHFRIPCYVDIRES